VCYKNSEATDITVTAANIVYGVEHDAAGNVRSTTKETNSSDQDNETTNDSFMGIVANAT